MAEKTVTVRLRALVDDYRKAMGQASSATQDVATKAGQWKSVGQSASELGASLTRNVTLPIVGVGVAAGKMALDFDNTFAQMKGLAGVSADEVDGLKESVMGLAGATGRGPQELAEALYFIRSSGLAGKDALDALEVSAKASASGLGSTVVVADAVTSAMNGYAKSGLSAADATDVLVATARAGKAEPAELAAKMGGLIPVAAELGISFQDVGAGIASLSLTGNNAAASATLLSNVMGKLLKPSQQASELLDGVGLSTEKLREMIADKGLLGTLEALKARLGDAGFVKFMEDQQAVQGALALTGENVEKNREIFDDLNHSVGASSDAFKQTDSDARKMSQAWARIQVGLIQVGGVIAPVAADVAGLVAMMAGGFAELPGPVKTAVVAFAMLAAAAGPVLWIGGKVITTVSAISTAMTNFATPAGSVAGAFNRVDTAAGSAGRGLGRLPAIASAAAKGLALLGVAAAGLEIFNKLRVDRVADELKGLADIDTGNLDSVREGLRAYREELDALDDREGKGRLLSVGGANLFATSGDADRQERIDQLRDKIAGLEEQEESLAGQEAETAAAFVGTTDAVSGLTEATTDAVSGLQDMAEALAAQFDPLFGMTDALLGNEEAQAGVTAAQVALNEARAQHGANSEEARAAEEALAQAHRDATGSAMDVTTAAFSMQAAIEAGTLSVRSAKDQLAIWVGQGLITQATADVMAGKFDEATVSAEALGATDPNVDASVTDRASGPLGWLQGKSDTLGRSSPSVHAGARDNASGILGGIATRVGELDGRSATVSVNLRTTGFLGNINRLLGLTGGRAAGGNVQAGMVYRVGEAGEEYFSPEVDGRIIPHHRLSEARPAPAGGGAGMGGTYIDQRQLHVTTGADPDAVVQALARWERQNGRLPVGVRRGG